MSTGFRIDVAHGMAKAPGLPDMEVAENKLLSETDDDPRFNNDSVHEIHRFIRAVLDDYDDAVAVGEVWVYDNAQFAAYLRHDELHLGFNFRLVRAEFDAAEIRRRDRQLPGRGRAGGRDADVDAVQSRRRA